MLSNARMQPHSHCLSPLLDATAQAHDALRADTDAQPATHCLVTSNGVESESDSDCEQQQCHRAPAASARKLKKKRVRWSTITIHEFGVGLGGSAVPAKGGPSIGLADVPEFTWTTKVGEMAECSEGIHRFTPDQRIHLLQSAGVPDGIIARYANETKIILGSRRRTMVEDPITAKRRPRTMKRSAEQAHMMDCPWSAYTRRPRMIPTNYV